jgi:chromosome segregation ATPase
MIEQLHNLKKTQTDQRLMQKGQLLSKIERIDAEILITKTQIDTATVQKIGAISDFTVLQMHKNTMKSHISKLEIEKNNLNKELELLIKDIVELQKETEQFGYILEEQKQEAIKRILVAEEEEANEYIQSKYISG